MGTHGSPFSTPATRRAFQYGSNLFLRAYMTLLRYSKICEVDNSWPSSVMISSVLRGKHDTLSVLSGEVVVGGEEKVKRRGD